MPIIFLLVGNNIRIPEVSEEGVVRTLHRLALFYYFYLFILIKKKERRDDIGTWILEVLRLKLL